MELGKISDSTFIKVLSLTKEKNNIFQYAQELFEDYQKNGKSGCLIDALDILSDEINIALGTTKNRIENLKATICKYVNAELIGIIQRYNIKEFTRNIKDIGEIKNLIAGSFSGSDLNKFIELMKIKSDYCE